MGSRRLILSRTPKMNICNIPVKISNSNSKNHFSFSRTYSVCVQTAFAHRECRSAHYISTNLCIFLHFGLEYTKFSDWNIPSWYPDEISIHFWTLELRFPMLGKPILDNCNYFYVTFTSPTTRSFLPINYIPSYDWYHLRDICMIRYLIFIAARISASKRCI